MILVCLFTETETDGFHNSYLFAVSSLFALIDVNKCEIRNQGE